MRYRQARHRGATAAPGGAAVQAGAAPTSPDEQGEPRFLSMGVGRIPRDAVPALAQDRDGFLWPATGDGLVRFDGHQFRAQERDSLDPAARNLGWVRALRAVRDDRLWTGTEADGLGAARAIRATPAGREVPIVALTALALDEDRRHARMPA